VRVLSELPIRREQPRNFLDEAGIGHADVDHLMIYDAFAHLPIYGLEDLGFVPRGEAGAFIAERNTAPRCSIPKRRAGAVLVEVSTGNGGHDGPPVRKPLTVATALHNGLSGQSTLTEVGTLPLR